MWLFTYIYINTNVYVSMYIYIYIHYITCFDTTFDMSLTIGLNSPGRGNVQLIEKGLVSDGRRHLCSGCILARHKRGVPNVKLMKYSIFCLIAISTKPLIAMGINFVFGGQIRYHLLVKFRFSIC